MDINYILLAAKTMAEKAEKEEAYNIPSSQSYRMAAKKYRQAAEMDSSKKEEYISLAEKYEKKALGVPSSATPQNNNKQNGNQQFQGERAGVTKTSASAIQTGRNDAQGQNSEEITVEHSMEKLNALIGLTGVKEKVKSWIAQIEVNKLRQSMGFPVPEGFSYHLVFTGNPGTGKTTVARIMSEIYYALGILQTGQLIETSRSDLVAGYEGQTGERTKEKIQSALGGVLFVDEAYTLCGNGRDQGKDPFGQEAIDELLKAMEDYRSELVVIVAGYTDLMEKFLESNPGLKSRFNTIIEFEDYSDSELYSIFAGLCSKNKYYLNDAAQRTIKEHFKKIYKTRDKNFGNARTVRNLFQQIVLTQSERLYKLSTNKQLSEQDLTTITEIDLFSALNKDNNNVSLEYEKVKSELSDANIFVLLSKGDLNSAAVAICTRLEALLKYCYKCNGELYEMVKDLKANQTTYGINLNNSDFDRLYKVRTFRNNFVHSGKSDQSINETDVSECLKIIRLLENKN